MTNITLFAQVISKIPQDLIKSVIKKYGTDKHAKGFNLSGSERWVMHKMNSNLFQTLEGNTYLDNVLWCKSKQIFVQLT